MACATTPTPAAATLDQLAEATPDSRDRYIDFLRAVAIAMVAIGHWLVVVPVYRDGTFDGVNALETVPLMHWLSWLFQVMPLFFIVGGYANSVSWRSAQRRGEDWSSWVRGRFQRLLRPTVAFVAVWVVLGATLRTIGVDPALVHMLAWLVVVPLWFLAVYVVIVALAPLMLWLHDHFGIVVPILLAVAAAFVDSLRIRGGMNAIAYSNFFLVFLFCQQLGFFWRDGRLQQQRWQPWAMLLGGVATLLVLTQVGPYPVSMVGVPGEDIANNAPPTITFLALGLAQAGLALLVRPPINRWLQRRRPWAGVIAINAHALTIHVWHFTALVIVALVVLPLGVVPAFADGSAAWWGTRWLAVPVLSVPLFGLVQLFGRVERRQPARSRLPETSPSSVVLTVIAVLTLAAAFCLITVGGLSVVDAPMGVPVVALSLLGAGTAIVRRPGPFRVPQP